MKVLVSGATGFLGKALTRRLRERGDEVLTLTRRPERAQPPTVGWDPSSGRLDASALDGLDAAVHLAGESIAAGRWTETQKRRIVESRVKGTTLLSEALAEGGNGPRVLISASAIGFYGDRGAELLTEDSEAGEGFLSDVCVAWEAAAEPARAAGIRVVHPRIGIVLSPEGGALQKMLMPFKLGLGGPIGSGKQYMSWIALEDVVGLLLQSLDDETLSGPVNLTAPEPVENVAFTRALGRALSRPSVVPLPSFAARLILGEMADGLLLASTRVLPAKARSTSYDFHHTEIQACLEELLS